MSVPMAVQLTSVATGEQKIFGSLAQTSEFLHRSKGYIRWKIFNEQTDRVFNKENEEFILELIGEGRRRDWKPKPRKQCQPRKYYPISVQLCTGCARAVGFCPWSAFLEPVPGWEAEPVKNISDGSTSFRIISCPMYWQDAPDIKGRMKQRKILEKELEREIEEGKRGGSPGTSVPSAARERTGIRAAVQAMAEAAAGASDQRECALC